VSLFTIQPFPGRRSDFVFFVKSQKCPYHVNFDLSLDLEHILDAGPSRDHPVSCANLVVIEPFACEKKGFL